MNILITGCSGFVGSRFVDLLKSDHTIVGVDIEDLKDGYPYPHLFYKINPNTFKEDLDKIKNLHFDAVLHIGAYSNTLGKDASYIYMLNFVMSIAYLELATSLGVPFIWASTAATYGDGSLGFDDDDSLGYLKKLKQLNHYAASKNAFDIYVRERTFDSKVIGLKYFNVYGPFELHKGKMMSCAMKFYHEAQLLGKIFLFDKGSLKQTVSRNFIFVDDIVTCTMKVLKTLMPNGIYHLGSLGHNSFEDIAQYVSDEMEPKPVIERIQPFQHLLAQYQYKTEADTTRLRQYVPDYKPHTLQEGVKAYMDWIRQNRALTEQYMSQYDVMALANP